MAIIGNIPYFQTNPFSDTINSGWFANEPPRFANDEPPARSSRPADSTDSGRSVVMGSPLRPVTTTGWVPPVMFVGLNLVMFIYPVMFVGLFIPRLVKKENQKY